MNGSMNKPLDRVARVPTASQSSLGAYRAARRKSGGPVCSLHRPWIHPKTPRPLRSNPMDTPVAEPKMAAALACVEVDRGEKAGSICGDYQPPVRLARRGEIDLQPVAGLTRALEHQPLRPGGITDDRDLVPWQALGQLRLGLVPADSIEPRSAEATAAPPIDQPRPHDHPSPSGGSRSARPTTPRSEQK
jgi:hypothetical protein